MKEGVRSPDKLFLHLIDIKQIKDTFWPWFIVSKLLLSISSKYKMYTIVYSISFYSSLNKSRIRKIWFEEAFFRFISLLPICNEYNSEVQFSIVIDHKSRYFMWYSFSFDRIVRGLVCCICMPLTKHALTHSTLGNV